MSDPIHLGMGIVYFPNAVKVNQDLIIPYLSGLRSNALKQDYTIIHDDTGEPIYAINRSGHRYALEDISSACNHIVDFSESEDIYKDFFYECENIIYQCLLKYIEIFPMLLPCLWWKTKGHVVAYGAGSSFGLHCDNDINYQPGAIPDQQLAIRNVVGSLLYMNSCVKDPENADPYCYTGGEIQFPYAGVKHSPKSGDILMFPSNYLGTHEVLPVLSGERYAYVGYFAQGSSDPERGININNDTGKIDSGQAWMPTLFADYKEYINEKYEENNPLKDNLLKATKRQQTSNDTTKEVLKEKQKNDL